jgi:hypothetical protein
LTGITSPTGLWRAETALMARVEQDGLRLLRSGMPVEASDELG